MKKLNFAVNWSKECINISLEKHLEKSVKWMDFEDNAGEEFCIGWGIISNFERNIYP